MDQPRFAGLLLLPLVLGAFPASAQTDAAAPPYLQTSFAGRWVNTAGPVVTALEVELKGPSAVVRAWGRCAPADCDWGTAEADVYLANAATRGGPALAAVFTRDGVENRVIIHAAGTDRLAVEVLSRFPDDASRNATAFAVLDREGATRGTLRLAPAGQRPVRVGGAIRAPVKLKNVPAVYPEAAKQSRIQGLIVLECTIGTDGSVVDLRPLRGESQELIDAAIEAVRQWRYSPTLLDGVAVPVIMTVTVNFKLS